jgi:hypothetical protein
MLILLDVMKVLHEMSKHFEINCPPIKDSTRSSKPKDGKFISMIFGFIFSSRLDLLFIYLVNNRERKKVNYIIYYKEKELQISSLSSYWVQKNILWISDSEIRKLWEQRLYKQEGIIVSHQIAIVKKKESSQIINMVANNYVLITMTNFIVYTCWKFII